MEKSDNIELLKECTSGVKMAVSSIDDMMEHVKSNNLKDTLSKSKNQHEKLGNECEKILSEFMEKGKEPNVMAKSMSWIKTNMKLGMDESDAVIADLVTEGCNMGVKSLNKYMNQYKAADNRTKGIAEELIGIERQLTIDVSQYL